MVEKKANHQANIVVIEDVKPHTNADNLELINIGLFQVVVRRGDFKAGDKGVYIEPDSVVPQTEPFKFIWENYEGLDGKVPEKRRRITVRKFRGELSEGLLLPLSDFSELQPNSSVGDDVSDILGITHYDPDAGKENSGNNMRAPRKKQGPKSIKGWFYFILYKLFRYSRHGVNISRWDTEDGGLYSPIYDVKSLKNFAYAFREGEEIWITEKIHGSNARYVYLDGHMYAGSHTQWKSETSPCVWRNVLKDNPWIEIWCKENEGYILYGEVTPTQGKDWSYGSSKTQFFVFDIYTPDGEWLSPWNFGYIQGYTIRQRVPLLYRGEYTLDKVKEFVSGPSMLYDGIREGIVVAPVVERQVHRLGRLKLKLVSPEFLIKDSK